MYAYFYDINYTAFVQKSKKIGVISPSIRIVFAKDQPHFAQFYLQAED